MTDLDTSKWTWTIESALGAIAAHNCSYGAGTGVAVRAAHAMAWLESQGHTVTARSRSYHVGGEPSSMVYLDGDQVR